MASFRPFTVTVREEEDPQPRLRVVDGDLVVQITISWGGEYQLLRNEYSCSAKLRAELQKSVLARLLDTKSPDRPSRREGVYVLEPVRKPWTLAREFDFYQNGRVLHKSPYKWDFTVRVLCDALYHWHDYLSNCDTPPQLPGHGSSEKATGKMSACAAQLAGVAEAIRPGSPKTRKQRNRSPRQICKAADGVGGGASVCNRVGKIPLDVAERKKRWTAVVLLEGKRARSTLQAETPQKFAERPEPRPAAAEVQQAKGEQLRTPPPLGPTDATSMPRLLGRKRSHSGTVVVAIPQRSHSSRTCRPSCDARTEFFATGSPSFRRSPRKRQPANMPHTAVSRSDSEPSDSGEDPGASELAGPSQQPIQEELDVDVRQDQRVLYHQRRAPRPRSQERRPAGSTGKIADRLGTCASGVKEAASGAKAEDSALNRPSCRRRPGRSFPSRTGPKEDPADEEAPMEGAESSPDDGQGNHRNQTPERRPVQGYASASPLSSVSRGIRVLSRLLFKAESEEQGRR